MGCLIFPLIQSFHFSRWLSELVFSILSFFFSRKKLFSSTHSGWVIVMNTSMQSLVHDPFSSTSNGETFLHKFLQNYLKILKKCFLVTVWKVILSISIFNYTLGVTRCDRVNIHIYLFIKKC